MRLALSICLIVFGATMSWSQDNVEVLSTSQFRSYERIFLAPMESWIFKKGNVDGAEKLDIDISDWQVLNPTQITKSLQDPNGRVEGWFRIKIKLDESFEGVLLAISRDLWAATDVYMNGELLHSFGDTGKPYTAFNPTSQYPVPIALEVGKEYLIAIHFVDYETTFTQRELRLKPQNLQGFINLTGPSYRDRVTRGIKDGHVYGALSIAVSFLLFFLFWLLVYLNPEQKVFKLIALLTSFTLLGGIATFFKYFYELSYDQEKIRFLIENTLQPVSTVFGLLILEWILTNKISITLKVIFILLLITNFLAHLFTISLPFGIAFLAMLVYLVYLLYNHRALIKGAQLAIVASLVVPTITAFVWITIHKYSLDLYYEYDKPLTALLTIGTPVFLLIYISVRFKELLNEVSNEAEKVIKVTEEKKQILADQNVVLDKQVKERTQELNQSLENLKATQSQLIHSEKMASLGELTAGIAHEIQNPLNFVNNFSDVSEELVEELQEEANAGNIDEVKEIATDLKDNLGKIHHHGKRASDIVKSMLEHSRSGDGKKEPTDINKLADDYLRLAYHGLRAKDKSFNADFELEIDDNLPKVNVVPQDIGRVLLNLINNAFHAVSSESANRSEKDGGEYKPKVVVTTKGSPVTEGGLRGVEITVSDNGPGIPDEIKDKIFQPFFTTKATGEGTGLGLSMSYDIITKGHGGQIKVESTPGKGTQFIIELPDKPETKPNS